ncbi:MAG: glycosyltransferase [Elusimicrobiota bacterium]
MSDLSTPLVCICVPTYNAGKTLSATLDSILGQTYRNLVIKVVDNASTDNTPQIADVCASKDLRVTVIRHADNVGAEGNFTRCLQLAEGDYTAIFHSDDIYAPQIVEEQVKFFQNNPEAGAVFAMADTCDATGRVGRSYRLPLALSARPSGLYDFPAIFKAMLKHGNFLLCPGAMARSEIYKDHIKHWNGDRFNTSADLDVWLRILQKYPIGVINKPLFNYRVSPASFSYGAGRAKTEPHDLLRVFEAYAAGFARDLMGPEEKSDYSRLLMNDNVNRSFNLAAMGKPAEARALLAGVFRPGSLSTAFCSVYHLKTVALAVLAALLIFIPLPERVKRQISIWRFKTRG